MRGILSYSLELKNIENILFCYYKKGGQRWTVDVGTGRRTVVVGWNRLSRHPMRLSQHARSLHADDLLPAVDRARDGHRWHTVGPMNGRAIKKRREEKTKDHQL